MLLLFSVLLLQGSCSEAPRKEDLSDEEFARILVEALKIQTIHVGKADSIRKAREELLARSGVTREALREYIERRGADPEVWLRLVEVLEEEFRREEPKGEKFTPP